MEGRTSTKSLWTFQLIEWISLEPIQCCNMPEINFHPCSMNETCLDYYLTNTWQKMSTFVHLLTKGGARPGKANSSIVEHLWMPQFSGNNQTNEAIKVLALLFHIHSLKVFLGHSKIKQNLLWWRSSGSSWSRHHTWPQSHLYIKGGCQAIR